MFIGSKPTPNQTRSIGFSMLLKVSNYQKVPSWGDTVAPSVLLDIQKVLNISEDANTRTKVHKKYDIKGIEFTKDSIRRQMTMRNS